MSHRLVYAAISPANQATVIDAQWRSLGVDFPGQTHCYLKRESAYAADIARLWHATQYSAGYVVQLRVREYFLQRFPLQTIAYDHHLEYRVPSAELQTLSHHLVGRIHVLRAYHSEPRCRALQREIQWSQAL